MAIPIGADKMASFGGASGADRRRVLVAAQKTTPRPHGRTSLSPCRSSVAALVGQTIRLWQNTPARRCAQNPLNPRKNSETSERRVSNPK